MNFYLGLDFGTSGARACVLNDVEAVIHEDRWSYPDAAAQTPLDWRVALLTLIRRRIGRGANLRTSSDD